METLHRHTYRDPDVHPFVDRLLAEPVRHGDPSSSLATASLNSMLAMGLATAASTSSRLARGNSGQAGSLADRRLQPLGSDYVLIAREAMRIQTSLWIRITPTRWGPIATGGFPADVAARLDG